MNRLPVSIVKCENFYEEENVIQGVEEALELIGGLREIVNPSDTVLLKPNFVTSKMSGTGAITNSYVLKGLAKAAKKAGAKRIIIGESSFLGEDTEKAFQVNKLEEYFAGTRVELVDFKKDEYVTVPIETGKVVHNIKLPKTYLDADVVINVPVLKTHDVFPVSLGMKNLKGVLRDTDKRRFHKLGLEQAVIDLNRVAMPDLVFYDGIIGMEGHGPIHGDPVELGVMIASRNILAAEMTAANIMGFEKEELPYLCKAEEQGLGCLDDIQIVGRKIQEVRKEFKRGKNVYDYLKQYDIKVYDEHACSKCKSTLNSLILGNLEIFESIKGYTICMGNIPEEVKNGSVDKDKLILIGSCERNFADGNCLYIPGCSPTQISLINTIKRKRNLSML